MTCSFFVSISEESDDDWSPDVVLAGLDELQNERFRRAIADENGLPASRFD